MLLTVRAILILGVPEDDQLATRKLQTAASQ